MGNEEKLSTYTTLGECSSQTLQRAEPTWDLLFKQHCQEIKKKKKFSAIDLGLCLTTCDNRVLGKLLPAVVVVIQGWGFLGLLAPTPLKDRGEIKIPI